MAISVRDMTPVEIAERDGLSNKSNAPAPLSNKPAERLLAGARDAAAKAKSGEAFDKTAYQRDYMRKRRAKAKGA